MSVPDGAYGTLTGDVALTVEDVTLADAPARVVASASYPGPPVLRPGPFGPFTIEGPAAGGTLALRVSVDVDADGVIGGGDLISTRRHPVQRGPQVMVVDLTRLD